MDKNSIMDPKKNAPVCLFFYNRPQFVVPSLESLANCSGASETDLYVFIDGPRSEDDIEKVGETRSLVSGNMDNKFSSVTVFESKMNNGLANSIISGVSKVIDKHGVAIVLEDDLVVSTNFLDYMNSSLVSYENDLEVGSVSGFGFNVKRKGNCDNFFHFRPSSWGWATWKNRWEKAIWSVSDGDLKKDESIRRRLNRGGQDMFRMLKAYTDGKIDSWAIRWAYTHSIFDWVASCPFESKVKNFGYGEEATNCKGDNPFEITFDESSKRNFSLESDISLDGALVRKMNWYNSNLYRLISKAKRLFQ